MRADGHVRLRHSDDDGRTLSAPVEVNASAERIYAEGENRPKIAFGPHDEIYVSWSQPRAKPWTGFVRFARSLDRGEHFSAPLTVHHDRAEITHRFDALAVDGNGRIVIAWIDKRDVIAATAHGKPYLGAAIYYSWSDDGGASFVAERKLVDQSCECCRIALARTPDGEIAAFFRSIYGDNIRDHAYAVLRTDGQPSHGRARHLQRLADRRLPASRPGPGDRQRRHPPRRVVRGQGQTHDLVRPARSRPRAETSAGHRHGTGASHADVAVHGRTVWVVWNQVGADGYALMLRRSTDNGAHFDAAREIARSRARSARRNCCRSTAARSWPGIPPAAFA